VVPFVARCNGFISRQTSYFLVSNVLQKICMRVHLKRLRPLFALMLATFVCLPTGLSGQEAPAPRDTSVAPGDRLNALVEKIRIESSRRTSMEADFVQVKSSALLKEPLKSSGVFTYQAPDRARWEYELPEPVSLVIEGEEMLTWYHDLGRAERIEVGRLSSKVLEYLSASSSIGTLLEYFTVYLHTPEDPTDPYLLNLIPRYKRLEKRLKQLEIWIEPQGYVPVRLRYTEADGDITDYLFENVRINEDIPPERFELSLPDDIEIEERRLGEGDSGG
jgi:outer membrane lipoprotein-sorting protein